MAAYLETLYADLRAAVIAAWPDVAANGVWDNEHVEMIPWDALTPPIAVIEIGDLPSTDDYGVANRAYEGDVAIYYVGEITGDSAPTRGKLEILRDALLALNPATAFWQMINVTDLSWSDNIEPNAVFESKDYTHRAGKLVAHIVVGDWS